MRSVCHDLRSPLTGILGFSGILVQEHGEALAPEAMLLLEKIRGSALRLHQLIEDLSRLARFGRHPLNPQPVDVAALVASVGSEMSHHESGREVTLGLGDLPAVTADPTLLRQVFASLLSNAYKFTRGRTPAVVEVGSLVQDGERVWYVRDNGTGFNMAYAGKLFGLFQRMHRADEFEGSGVGLAIAQRIVQRHGGRIWFEAAPQQGASFYFTLSQPA
jgi:light-regulated signal transduction histidine kinase (bacteriophytochrome)